MKTQALLGGVIANLIAPPPVQIVVGSEGDEPVIQTYECDTHLAQLPLQGYMTPRYGEYGTIVNGESDD